MNFNIKIVISFFFTITLFASFIYHKNIEVNIPLGTVTENSNNLVAHSDLETIVNWANLRAEGSKNASVIDVLPQGTVLTYLGVTTSEKFHATIENVRHHEPYLKVKVHHSNKIGWIFKACTEWLNEKNHHKHLSVYHVTSSKLYLRAGPGLHHHIIHTLSHNTILHHDHKISEEKDKIKIGKHTYSDFWYHVHVNGTELKGWVYGAFIDQHELPIHNEQEEHHQAQVDDHHKSFHIPEGYSFNKETGELEKLASSNTDQHFHITSNQIHIQFKHGLRHRRPSAVPIITRPSDFVGKMIFEVCVDEKGNVRHTKFDHHLSSTQNLKIVDAIQKEILHFSFRTSTKDYQCGKVEFDFLPEHSVSVGN